MWEKFRQNSDQLQFNKQLFADALCGCYRSIPMAATGRHYMNKSQRKSFLQNAAENLGPYKKTGV